MKRPLFSRLCPLAASLVPVSPAACGTVSPPKQTAALTQGYLLTVRMHPGDNQGAKVINLSLGTADGGQTAMDFANLNRPLNTGITGVTWDVYSAPDVMGRGTPAATAVKATIFGYDKGVQMVGMTAPARRVGLMFGGLSAGHVAPHWASSLLFRAAVTWAASGN